LDASNNQSRTLTIWRFSDGKAGHDAQSVGLVQALSDLTSCTQLDIRVPPALNTLACLVGAGYLTTKTFPDPDLIIGAGHATHLPLLCAKKYRGGNTVVIMTPSLPTSWFDLCLVPAHDDPKLSKNIVLTKGAMNTIKAGNSHQPHKGLILIGGPSKHFSWNTDDILNQIKTLINGDIQDWVISDSPRTPAETRNALQTLSSNRIHYCSHDSTDKGWLAEQLGIAGTTWVSEDSVSMIYEALTSGTAVGLLRVSPKHSGRIQKAVNPLIKEGYLTRFESWCANQKLTHNKGSFSEADRCARLVLDRLFPLPDAGHS